MKVRVKTVTPEGPIDEVFAGPTAEAVVAAMQKAVASRLGFAMRFFVNSMSPSSFAQEVVKRYNQETRKSIPIPKSCDEFLKLGEQEGIVTVLEA